jgi:hypothetical protein
MNPSGFGCEDCDGCHDGKHAFKTTGFECFKCHQVNEK